MNRPAHFERSARAGGFAQWELFEPPPFSPKYPKRSTLAWAALMDLLSGKAITHPDFQTRTSSWRLSEPIRVLRHEFGWPVVTIEIPAPTKDRPKRYIAKYVLPDWVIRAVGGIHV